MKTSCNMIRKFLKRKFHGLLVRHLFRLPTEEEILRIDQQTGAIYLNGTELDEPQKKELMNSAKALADLPAYSFLTRALIRHAGKRLYYESRTEDDIVAAKMMLYTVDLMEKMRDNIERFK